MEPAHTYEPLSEVRHSRPFAVRGCPPEMRIRGGWPMRADRRRRGPGHPDANQKVVSQICKARSEVLTTPNVRAHPHMKRPNTGLSYQEKTSLGVSSSTPLTAVRRGRNLEVASEFFPNDLCVGLKSPVLPMVKEVKFIPELLSDDPRVRVKSLLFEYNNLRRRFSAEDKLKVKQPGEPRTHSRPDFRASEELKPFRPYNESIHGKIPGVEVGDHYHYRMEMFTISLHRQSQGGIDYIPEGRSTFKNDEEQPVSVAVSVIASGGYEDDEDMGDTIIYTGQGGNAEKKSKKECKDQELERGNLALKNSCDLKLAVRVVKKQDLKKQDLKNAQRRSKKDINNQDQSSFIYFYDGLYDVLECYQERGISGRMVWKYKLFRQPNHRLL